MLIWLKLNPEHPS